MMTTRGTATAGVLLLAMAGCAGGEAPAATPEPVPSVQLPPSTSAAPTTAAPTTARPTPTPTPTPGATGGATGAPVTAKPTRAGASAVPAADQTRAVATLDQWWTQLERAYSDPSVPVESLDPLTTGDGRETTRAFVEGARQDGVRAKGHARWVSQQITEAYAVQGMDVVRIKTCQDVSKMRVIDAKGKDVTPEDREDRTTGEYLVSRATDGPWQVSYIAGTGAAC